MATRRRLARHQLAIVGDVAVRRLIVGGGLHADPIRRFSTYAAAG